MSATIKAATNLPVSTQAVGGVSGVFFPGRTLDVVRMAIENTKIEQSLSGFYYQWAYAANNYGAIDPTSTAASQETIGGVSGVFVTNLDGANPASVAADGTTLVNIVQGTLGSGNCARGRSGVS